MTYPEPIPGIVENPEEGVTPSGPGHQPTASAADASSQSGTPNAGLCDVCRQREALGVASSALGPVSWAYCRECLNKPADVACMFAATIDGCNGSANVADWVKNLWTWEDGHYISFADFAVRHEEGILADAAERDAHDAPIPSSSSETTHQEQGQ